MDKNHFKVEISQMGEERHTFVFLFLRSLSLISFLQVKIFQVTS